MNSKIKHIDYFLPETIMHNETLIEDFPEWTAKKIEEKLGIQQRHIAGEKETALDLALKASSKVLQNYDKDKIDFLILCTQSPDYFLPPSACILQDKLNLGQGTGAFDMNLGCSGFVYGLAVSKGLVAAGIASNVLLVTAETYSKHIHPQDRANRTIFGDGAAATIIESSNDKGILEFDLGTDGSGFENLIVKSGGLRHKTQPFAPEISDKHGNIRTENNLYMNGSEIFNFTIEAVPKSVNNILENNNASFEDIDYIIFHQANKFMLNYLRKLLRVPEEKFYINLLQTGNTVSSTIPIALKNCLDNKTIKTGDKVLLLGFGVGYSWAGTIIQI